MTSLKKLRQHMPELLPIYERLVELAGGGDLAARFLSLYRPPPYLLGCSQAVWPGRDPVLVRNYDYSPALVRGEPAPHLLAQAGHRHDRLRVGRARRHQRRRPRRLAVVRRQEDPGRRLRHTPDPPLRPGVLRGRRDGHGGTAARPHPHALQRDGWWTARAPSPPSTSARATPPSSPTPGSARTTSNGSSGKTTPG